MRRRDFIALLGGAAAAWPLPACAQQQAMPVVGVLNGASPSPLVAAFLQGLREAGFVDHQNVLIAYRYARGTYERLPALAAELVALRVDLILAAGTPAVRVAKTASVLLLLRILIALSLPAQLKSV
jgi:putative ABC transport system substrate-binding protein